MESRYMDYVGAKEQSSQENNSQKKSVKNKTVTMTALDAVKLAGMLGLLTLAGITRKR